MHTKKAGKMVSQIKAVSNRQNDHLDYMINVEDGSLLWESLSPPARTNIQYGKSMEAVTRGANKEKVLISESADLLTTGWSRSREVGFS